MALSHKFLGMFSVRTFVNRHGLRSFASNAEMKEDSHLDDLFDNDSYDQPNDNQGEMENQQSYEPRRRYRTGINRVELLGGVGNKPIERVSRNGVPYAAFNLYTNINFQKKTGETFHQTEMHTVMAFGNMARYVKYNVDKGIRVFVQGRLHYTGGVLMGDGTRTPRVASVAADTILPVAQSKYQDFQEAEYQDKE